MNTDVLVSAAIVTYNDIDCVPTAVESVLKNTKKYPLKFYVIDNNSTDGTADLIEKSYKVSVIRQNKNLGFGAGHNIALGQQLGKYHFVINPDISFDSDVISDMVDYFENNSDVIMAMPKILNLDGTEQKLPKERPTFKRLFLGRLFSSVRSEYVWANKQITTPTEIDFCTGCFFCIRTNAFEKLGGFDERYFMYLEDADLALKAKQLGKVMILPQFSVTHMWERECTKSLKYLILHIISGFKFLFKWRGKLK
ncbi:MAG: glycosyltransferase family 2 protein [Clostridia bacterium]|nr:glycosyltransferase family 2 protein [Clostridia bacterium]